MKDKMTRASGYVEGGYVKAENLSENVAFITRPQTFVSSRIKIKTIAAYALVIIVLGGFVALCAVSDFNNYAKLQTKTQKVVTV